MSFVKAALAKLAQLFRAGRPSPFVRVLLALGLFWLCFVHVLPSLSSGLLIGKNAIAYGWTPQMAAEQTPLTRWDARWYHAIASNGYYTAGPDKEGSVRFYPLFPMMMAATKWLTGFQLFWSGTLVSALTLLGTLVLLAKRAREETSEEAGMATAEALLFFPSAFILASAYSESVTLFATVLAVVLARRGRWLGAGLAGAAAAMGRVNGVLVVLPLLALAISAWRADRRWKPAVAVAFASLGAAAYPAYLWGKFGDPLLYFHTRPPWWSQHPRFFVLFLWDIAKAALDMVSTGTVPKAVQTMNARVFPIHVAVLVLMGWALWASVRKRKWDDAAFMAGACLFATSVGNLDSMARYSLIYYPMYLRLGETAAAHRTFRLGLALVFLSTQAVLLTMFVRWVFVL